MMKQDRNEKKIIFDDSYEESCDQKNWKSRKRRTREVEKHKEKQRLRRELKSY